MLRFLERLDVDRLQKAIADAEARTSGELRISVSPFFWGNLQSAAERAFVRLGMSRTIHRNGVLFFVVPSRRKFVVLGDAGIHERVGDELWTTVADVMSPYFKRREYTDGLIAGIEQVAEALATHFPRETGDVNELSDVVDTERS